MKPGLYWFVAVLLWATGATAQAENMTGAAVRALMLEAQKESAGGNADLITMLDRKVRARWGEFDLAPAWIHEGDGISILLYTPYYAYRSALAERIRKMESIKNTPWFDYAWIAVRPSDMDAPNIIKVLVTRDGRIVKPLRVDLRPTRFVNRMGVATLLNAGTIDYSLEAFAPGATVKITAIPETGRNYERTLVSVQLAALK